MAEKERNIRLLFTLPAAMADRMGKYLSAEKTVASGMTDRTQLIRTSIDFYLNSKGA